MAAKANPQVQVRARFDTLEDIEIQCTHCGMRMKTHLGSGQVVRYFQCSSCLRWVSSMYREVINSSAQVRSLPKQDEPEVVDDVRARLERWLAAIDDQNPYRTLGCSPGDSLETIRSKYRERAMQCHPDRGGSAAKMQELNAAYERVLRHREQRKLESLPEGRRVSASELPDYRG